MNGHKHGFGRLYGMPLAAAAVVCLVGCSSQPTTYFDWDVGKTAATDNQKRHGRTSRPQTAARYAYSDRTADDRAAAPKPRPQPSSIGRTNAAHPDTAAATETMPFYWPVGGQVISEFGTGKDGQRNDGINIAAPEGTPIRAAAGGTVGYVGNGLKNYGNLLLIRHKSHYITAYAHAERISVTRGQTVKAGDIVGTVGESGDVAQPQLHFEIRSGVTPLDPRKLLVSQSAHTDG
jgi:murein DD-endopeptidase MepM/ murein hydrolase activator NlpD